MNAITRDRPRNMGALAAIKVPPHVNIEGFVRDTLSKYPDKSPTEIAALIGWRPEAFVRVSDMVRLCDMRDRLSVADRATVDEALDALEEDRMFRRAWKIATPVAARVWGDGKKKGSTRPHQERELRSKFETKMGFVLAGAHQLATMKLPYLSAEELAVTEREIAEARDELSAMLDHLKETRND